MKLIRLYFNRMIVLSILVEIKAGAISTDDDFYMQKNRIYSDIVGYEMP